MKMEGGFNVNPFDYSSCQAIAEGNFDASKCDSLQSYTGGADAGAAAACKAVVSACKEGSNKCNVVSTFKHPSCHTDAEGSSDAYRYCTFWTSPPGATPELDGHCDEATGCQGTFETMMLDASPTSGPDAHSAPQPVSSADDVTTCQGHTADCLQLPGCTVRGYSGCYAKCSAVSSKDACESDGGQWCQWSGSACVETPCKQLDNTACYDAGHCRYVQGNPPGCEEADRVASHNNLTFSSDWVIAGDACVQRSPPTTAVSCLQCAGAPIASATMKMEGGFNVNPFDYSSCQAIAEGNFDASQCDSLQSYTGGADAGAAAACKAVVSACQDPSKCNVVSTFKHPSCHTDPEGSSDAYRYCTFWTLPPRATPALDGHCDEAAGCQGTFETMMRTISPTPVIV